MIIDRKPHESTYHNGKKTEKKNENLEEGNVSPKWCFSTVTRCVWAAVTHVVKTSICILYVFFSHQDTLDAKLQRIPLPRVPSFSQQRCRSSRPSFGWRCHYQACPLQHFRTRVLLWGAVICLTFSFFVVILI